MERSVVTINGLIIIYHLNPLKATLWQGMDRWIGPCDRRGETRPEGACGPILQAPAVVLRLCKHSRGRKGLPQACEGEGGQGVWALTWPVAGTSGRPVLS